MFSVRRGERVWIQRGGSFINVSIKTKSFLFWNGVEGGFSRHAFVYTSPLSLCCKHKCALHYSPWSQ